MGAIVVDGDGGALFTSVSDIIFNFGESFHVIQQCFSPYFLNLLMKRSINFRIFYFSGKLGPAGHVYDVVFVIDSSSTVVSQDFERQKQFVKSFARQFGISRDRSRGALVTYGRYANLDFRFDGYENLDDFDAAVDRAESVGGERRMGRALDMASRVLHEARPKAYKVAILFTAGRQSQSAGSWFMESASRSLKNIGAKTYVVAIGNQPDSRELRPLVDRDSDILPVVSLANIDDLTGRTVTLVTDGTGDSLISLFSCNLFLSVDCTPL